METEQNNFVAVDRTDWENAQAIVADLKEVAARPMYCDDEEFDLNDLAAGNLDDAYSTGFADGMVGLARKLLA